MIRDDEIRDIMMRGADPVEICHQLIDEANEAGGHDNITAIIATFDGEDLKSASTEDTLALRYNKYTLPAWMGSVAADGGLGPGMAASGSVYDDTPFIEIHGEIELGPDDDWDDLFDDSPSIPTDAGPSWSTLAIVAAVIGIIVLVYFLSR
jgi:protein phosphatase